MKFCSECGTKLSAEGAKFCPECGVGLHRPAESLNPSPAGIDPDSREGVDLFNAGRQAGAQGNHAEAVRCFGPLAQAGDPQSAEACAYSLAMLGRQDEALPWLHAAAQAGLFDAATRLAVASAENGDSLRARQLFTITAEAGDVAGQGMLADLCIRARDFECAKTWWMRIVADNNPEHPTIVAEARHNLDRLQQDPGYIAHVLKQRRVGER